MTVPKKPLQVVPAYEPGKVAAQDVFPRDACLDWMRDKCDPKYKRHQVIAFSLSHIDARAVGDAFTDIDSVVLEVDEKTGALPQNISAVLEAAANTFWRAASAHCGAIFTNRQGYLIKGHHRGDMIEQDDGTKVEEDPLKVTPRTSFPFSATPPPGVRENYEGNEKATAEGALGSMQRTLDTALRNIEASNAKMMKGYESWNEKLIDKLTDTFEIITAQNRQLQDAEDRKITRQVQADEAKFKLETQSMIVDAIETKVLPIVELLVKAKLGIVPSVPALGEGQSAPQADPAALVATIRALDLTPSQIGNLVADLRPEQNAMLRPLLVELSKTMPEADQQELVDVVQKKTAEKQAAKKREGDPK